MEKPVRHFRSLRDLEPDDLRALIEHALRLKSGSEAVGRPLEGRTLAMIFRKRSTRTRVSFAAGISQLGGVGIGLSDEESHLGRGEALADTARVLSRYVDGILIRTFAQTEIEELAHHGSVPVINGLTDLLHPCQLLADLLTLREEFGPELEELRIAWIGDGNNMANSWLNAATMLGFELRLAVPEGYDPDPDILAGARAGGSVLLTRDPEEAADGAHAVCTDTWASMGKEAEAKERLQSFAGFQVAPETMEIARPDAIFLHCLPAHRGEEVAEEVIDGPRSRVFDEAENRLHAQKALLIRLLK
ncbi:MAG: ornithine carbamoyltransferase [Gemmatimonadota bacterium]